MHADPQGLARSVGCSTFSAHLTYCSVDMFVSVNLRWVKLAHNQKQINLSARPTAWALPIIQHSFHGPHCADQITYPRHAAQTVVRGSAAALKTCPLGTCKGHPTFFVARTA